MSETSGPDDSTARDPVGPWDGGAEAPDDEPPLVDEPWDGGAEESPAEGYEPDVEERPRRPLDWIPPSHGGGDTSD